MDPSTPYRPGQQVMVRIDSGSERPGWIAGTRGDLYEVQTKEGVFRVGSDRLRPAPDRQLSMDHTAHADELRVSATQLEQLANGFDHVAALAGSMGRSARNEVARIQRLALELGGG